MENKALEIIKKSGYDGFLVGGCIRDIMMGKTPEDMDICTNATPSKITEIFNDYKCITVGKDFGTIAVIIDGEKFEITTFRQDFGYKNSRKPSFVVFSDNIEEDLARRDFTVNAMAFDGEKVVDIFGGKEDIKNKTIRAVGDPEKRFKEDALRILRGIRFATVLDFSIEEKTKNAMIKTSKGILNISKERIRDEINKILLSDNPVRGLSLIEEICMKEVLPEFLAQIGFEQRSKHHNYTVFEHTKLVVKNTEKDIILRLAALCHDISKPECFYLEKGEGHFKGHAKSGEIKAKEFLKKYRYDNKTIKSVCELVSSHSREIEKTEKDIRYLLKDLGEENAERLLKLKMADDMSKKPENIKSAKEKYCKLLTLLKGEIEGKSCYNLKSLDIRGEDLKNVGIKQEKIGEILEKLLDLVIENQKLNKKEKLLEKSQHY